MIKNDNEFNERRDRGGNGSVAGKGNELGKTLGLVFRSHVITALALLGWLADFTR